MMMTLGQDVTLRVTKNTNVICADDGDSQLPTGREAAKEQEEIPPTPHMEKQAQQGKVSEGVGDAQGDRPHNFTSEPCGVWVQQRSS